MDRMGSSAAPGPASSEIDRLRAELAEAGDQVQKLARLLGEAEAKGAPAAEVEDLARRLRFAEEQVRDLAARLEETRDPPAWRAMQRILNHRMVRGVWGLAKRASPTWLRQEVKAWVRTRGVAEPPSETATLEGLSAFLSRVNDSQAEHLVLFVAGAKLLETEGQRATQLVRALRDQGLPVLLLYHRWRSEYHQPIPKTGDAQFHQVPMDLFERHRGLLLSAEFRPSLRRTCVFDLPHPWAAGWVEDLKSTGWVTVYDVIDDWEEFHKAGKALWYRPAAERYMLASCDAVTAVSASLAQKMERLAPGLDVRLVPNGVTLDSFDSSLDAPPVRRGEVTVGYFGFLTPAWFDWRLLIDVARRRPAWEFHIVGFGEPAPAALPKNLQLLGRVHHYQLAAHAKNWDVAMVPFRATSLGRSADPIKVYEYLALGLPVVATGVPHLSSYPGVRVAESAEEFERLLERAAAEPLDRDAVGAFLEGCAWSRRAKALLEVANRP